MRILFATTNKGKFLTFQGDMKAHGIEVAQEPIELVEPRSPDIEVIALSKIDQAFKVTKCPTAVMDAGFYIDAVKGFPRTFVNFALETIGIEGMLRLVEGKSRGCEFRNCLAYMDPGLKEPKLFFTHVRGRLAERPRGIARTKAWSELWHIFIPEGSEQTLAEMSDEEYEAWRAAHRVETSIAMQFHEWLTGRKVL